MKINKMQITNFCGIKNLCITPQGNNLNIFGDNATGKTTIANAFMWLFTGKGITGTAELDPQPLDGRNAKIHNLETSVELETDSGTTYKRVLSEVWQKKRGSAAEELTGTKTAYFIDGVPLKEKEYTARTEADFIGSELFKNLSVVSYFPTMDWKTRRQLLLDVFGDVKREDVLSASEELAELSDMLNGHSIEDYQKIIKAKKYDLRKEIDMIPARISENENNIPQLDGSVETHEKRLEQLNAEKTDIDARIAADISQQERRKAVSEAETKLQEAKKRFIEAQNNKNSGVIEYIQSLEKEKADIKSKTLSLEAEAENLSEETERIRKKREEYVERYKSESKRKYEGGEICPCCGQPLPQDKIEAAKNEFNFQKARTLEAINREGQKYSQSVIAENEGKFNELTSEISAFDEKYGALDCQIKQLRIELDNKAFEETEEYRELLRQLDDIKARPADNVLNRLKEQSEVLKGKIAEETKRIALFKAAETARARIAELEAQKGQLAAEYAHCEKGEYLCELFIRTKVSMLDERINSRFKTIRFKLFHTQANGGISEVCKVLIPCESGLVEYEKANNAAKINAGIEIINVLSEHFGVYLPVFVDNAESVTELCYCDNQVIRLIVSENDKTIRTENY